MLTAIEKQIRLVQSGHFVEMPHHRTQRDDPLDYLTMWVLAGRGLVRAEGREIEAKPGDLFLFRPHVPQEYRADPARPWDILWAHFDGKLAEPFVGAIRQFGGVRVELGLDPEIRDRWVELVIAEYTRDAGADVRCHTALAAVLGLIWHRLQVRSLAPDRVTGLDVHKLQSYIHEHLREPITLAQLAKVAHLSPTHFARVFKRQFAVSPLYYVIQKRVALACTMLTETDLPMKQVATAVGYDDPYYFSRIFRKVTGASPTRYRAGHRTLRL